MQIYAKSPNRLAIAAMAIVLLWTLLCFLTGKRKKIRILFLSLNCVLVFISVYGILYYTVLGRIPSGEHRFVLFNSYSNEFYREMFMNGLLYFPLGLSLAVLIGNRSILAAFALSFGIEAWQYFAGTGLAQGTDVLCNTLGCVIGAIPAWVYWKWNNAKQKER